MSVATATSRWLKATNSWASSPAGMSSAIWSNTAARAPHCRRDGVLYRRPPDDMILPPCWGDNLIFPERPDMSLDRSLKSANSLIRHRNVLTRDERLLKLKEEEKWTEAKSVFGLPKVAHRKAAVAKKEPAAADAAAVAAGTAPAAGAAAPAAGAAGKGAAAPAAGAKGAAPAKAAAAPAKKK